MREIANLRYKVERAFLKSPADLQARTEKFRRRLRDLLREDPDAAGSAIVLEAFDQMEKVESRLDSRSDSMF